MGCAQSKIENEEAVARCKDRKIFMKEAVAARNAFAAGHSGYTMALKNTGAALSDYGPGEVENYHPHRHQSHNHAENTMLEEPSSQPPIDMPPPPPPLPNFSPIPPLQRAVTMPEFPASKREAEFQNDDKVIHEEDGDYDNEDTDEAHEGDLRRIRQGRRNGAGQNEPETPPQMPSITLAPPPPPDSKNMAWDYFFMVDNMPGPTLGENEDIRVDNDEGFAGGGNVGGNRGEEIEFKTPEKVEEEVEPKTPEAAIIKGKQIMHSHSSTAPADIRRVSEAVSSVSLLQILGMIDDHFLKASESAHKVSKMLEANRLHYHSNFADNRGHIDHAARVMRVITWNRSFRGIPNGDAVNDDLDEFETHATVLDKLLAWEKKLFDEVKAGEHMKLEYQRKVALLTRQKNRGASNESLEKTKAAVSHLHTRYIVDMQSMDSTVSEVNHLRDNQLYPRLVSLVDGMAKMWDLMSIHHDNQFKIATDLKVLDISHAPKETSKHHHERTVQLWNVVQEWHLQFEKLVNHQKQYIQALNSWLKLNLIPTESSLKEKISSPPRAPKPPIQALLSAWHDCLDKLPDELAKSAVSSFAAVIKTIILQQDEEMKLKEKCEETRKEFLRKSQAFDDWYQKYRQRRNPDDTDPERGEDINHKDLVSEKQFAVESLKKRLEEEVEAHQKHCMQVREKSLGSLKTRLPELFRALSDYSHACSEAYNKLRSIAPSPNSNVCSS
ncbi:protein of unknown function DUF632 [Dillenia turbinata]|uniref:DUF632 domain-containing protein n=1 Tax=Dillenia turbinata TaxID=194707 RepID=A0AAN8V4K8_9MAGN